MATKNVAHRHLNPFEFFDHTGVDTDELSSKTTESHKVPGLFFIGEVVDVTGHLGGLNTSGASGAAAARTV